MLIHVHGDTDIEFSLLGIAYDNLAKGSHKPNVCS